jgi:hypothetical protein
LKDKPGGLLEGMQIQIEEILGKGVLGKSCKTVRVGNLLVEGTDEDNVWRVEVGGGGCGRRG